MTATTTKPVAGLKQETFEVAWIGGSLKLAILQETYKHGGKCVSLIVAETKKLNGEWVITGEAWCTLSVWVEASRHVGAGTWFLKDWSENQVIAEQMIDQGIICPVQGEAFPCGAVVARPYRLSWQCPACGLDLPCSACAQ